MDPSTGIITFRPQGGDAPAYGEVVEIDADDLARADAAFDASARGEA